MRLLCLSLLSTHITISSLFQPMANCNATLSGRRKPPPPSLGSPLLSSHSLKALVAWTLVKVQEQWSAPYLQPHTEDNSFLPMLLIFCLHPQRKTPHFTQQVFLPTAGSSAQEHLCIHTSWLFFFFFGNLGTLDSVSGENKR